jgi:signal transduction histidine kinase
MLEEVERLTQLVDAMLMLSRADAGRIPVNKSACDLAALVDEVATQLGVLAEEKHQTIVVTKTGAVRASVDPLILRMAIVNLVDNAIRYSPEGGTIAIDVQFSGSSAEVAVRDSGPGITPIHQQRLFERFYRVDDGRSRRSGGTGLGLAIARWAVEAHDGRLEVVSQPGSGSTFRIVLPAV